MKLLSRLSPLLMSLLLGACALSSASPGARITPAPTMVTAHRGPVLVQYCVDDTGSYPRADFQGANKLVANSLPSAVVANAESLTLYATLISSTTFDPSNTLAPFIIPAVPNYPALPASPPTPSQANPVSYSATATALADEQSGAIASYNAQMAAVKAQIDATRGQVALDAKRLTDWNPRVDSHATSVWGCLQLARSRFAAQAGTKYLIIASDMQNNTNVDYTVDFQSSQALKGVNVRVIYYACQTAGSCESLTATWKHIFTSSGATSVQFDDPAQSEALTSLFGGA